MPWNRLRIDLNRLSIAPKKSGVITMRDGLTIVSKELLETLFRRIPSTANRSEPPFSKRTRFVPCALKHLGQRKRLGRDRMLPLRKLGKVNFGLQVPSNLRMP